MRHVFPVKRPSAISNTSGPRDPKRSSTGRQVDPSFGRTGFSWNDPSLPNTSWGLVFLGMFWGSKYLHTDGVWKPRVIQQKWQFLTFVEGLCSNLPWKCGNFCHSSWFLKVDSGVWICQNNSCGGLYPGFKSCQAKGGWLTTETNGLRLKMDEWEFPFGMVQPGRCQLLVSGCWFCFQTWPSKSKMTRHWNLHVFWQTPADPRTENTSSASSPIRLHWFLKGIPPMPTPGNKAGNGGIGGWNP